MLRCGLWPALTPNLDAASVRGIRSAGCLVRPHHKDWRGFMARYQRRRVSALGAAIAAIALTWAIPQPAAAQDAPKKVVLRFAADFTPPPHPAGMALKIFAER